MSKMRTVNKIYGLAASGVVVLLVGGCGNSHGSGSYVGQASNAAIFISWTSSSGKLSGELNEAILGGDVTEEDESVNSDSTSFTGRISGSSVTLSLSGGPDLTGTFEGDDLSLDYPGRNGNIITVLMKPASTTAYNADLSRLRVVAAQANRQAKAHYDAVQQASHISDDAQNVEADLNNLASDTRELGLEEPGLYSAGLASEKTEVGQTETDMQTVLSEAGGANSDICADSDTVDSDNDTVQSDVDTIESDQDANDADVSPVSDDIAQLQHDAQALETDRESVPMDVPAGAPTQAMIADAIQTAKGAIAKANQASSDALAQANELEKTAAGYQAKADAACNSSGG